MKTTKILIAILVVLFLTTIKMNAQVTIGADLTPRTGTLLDLKTNANTNNAANATGGLGLPRVSLTNVNTLTIPGTATDMVGVTVYNVNANTTGGSGAGVYVWNGSNWTKSGINLRLDSVIVNPSLTEDVAKGIYKTLQRAYDMEALKIPNQTAGTPIKFKCSGSVGNLSTKSALIPYISLIGVSGANVGGMELFSNSVLFDGTINIGPTTTNFCHINPRPNSNLTFDALVLQESQFTGSGSGSYNLILNDLQILRGSVVFLESQANLVITNSIYMEGSSSISASCPIIFNGNASASILVTQNSCALFGGDLTINGNNSFAAIDISQNSYMAAGKISGSGKPNYLIYTSRGGTFLHQGGTINMTVSGIAGFMAYLGGNILLNGAGGTIARTGTGTASGVYSTSSGNINVSSQATGSYTFNGFSHALSADFGGNINGLGKLLQGTSTNLSNIPLGTVQANGSVIRNTP